MPTCTDPEGLSRYLLKRDDAVLLIIDVQDRLAAVMPEKDLTVAATVRLVEGAKLMSVPIIVTEQYPRGLGPTLLAISGALPEHQKFEKLSFSCCGEAGFDEVLDGLGRKSVLIAGMEAHICVLQTALALLGKGHDVHIARDAVCSRVEENKDVALDLMRDAGAVITTSEIALFQLLGRAGVPEFKAISALVK
ncbi:hydrolase [Methanomassiliicoccus luminyensis]|jgi:nicotinamidase-related amidase|uniref:hydrolase n=1 Tax=Methanomassiliicoccus luminyensis TaxID=1080712 RepID=UPI000377BECE|nr:hydrolase [Methanomassiliicoccus luminyensis]